MKIILHTLTTIALSLITSVAAATEANGFLVIEISRYTTEGKTTGSDLKQRFKIPLTAEFLLNLKNIPSQNNSGTGFYCSGGNLKAKEGSTRFTWWIRKTTDNRWSINMWGSGVETIKGVKVSSRNPSTSQYVTVKNWEDIDMTYLLSYVQHYDGINVSFTAKYVSEKDAKTLDSTPTAPVRKADHSELFKGDDQSELPLEIVCSFQEG